MWQCWLLGLHCWGLRSNQCKGQRWPLVGLTLAESDSTSLASGIDQYSLSPSMVIRPFVGCQHSGQPWFSFAIIFPQTVPIIDALLTVIGSRVQSCNTEKVKGHQSLCSESPLRWLSQDGTLQNNVSVFWGSNPLVWMYFGDRIPYLWACLPFL